ncbi:hypothetical protein G3A43_09270 [Paraburkholderia aspalathi]|nr:hypothetical protein [Paraburkholderia aspalathi]MBK3780417.1 hypothetical protein [Paraburkholderia aspalathi]
MTGGLTEGLSMKEKLYRNWSLLRAELSTAKGLFCFVCAAVFGTAIFASLFIGGACLMVSYVLAQLPANQLSQLESLTVAQLLTYFGPGLHKYLHLAVCASPVLAFLFEIPRSIHHQEMVLLKTA